MSTKVQLGFGVKCAAGVRCEVCSWSAWQCPATCRVAWAAAAAILVASACAVSRRMRSTIVHRMSCCWWGRAASSVRLAERKAVVSASCMCLNRSSGSEAHGGRSASERFDGGSASERFDGGSASERFEQAELGGGAVAVEWVEAGRVEAEWEEAGCPKLEWAERAAGGWAEV